MHRLEISYKEKLSVMDFIDKTISDVEPASKVLKLERNSLEYLLRYYCEVAANKESYGAVYHIPMWVIVKESKKGQVGDAATIVASVLPSFCLATLVKVDNVGSHGISSFAGHTSEAKLV
ncbi:hypothetical protein Tco_0736069 [Tanacetum coccineum]